ncbi:GNAT family N-acetyltransferase [Kaistia nematophila]|uniref:GNAT family N-acetyltransferase n=1 Tax=Kaistia nematophila TaxID=2994654 RepID=A0A9X3IN63_9HYPH|nr:GNAT family N-acetyltransferase [Kaistia nematophila]MCX5571266.1 GNAT family N-acetyltransferase [Kaistia nematophila]
MGSDVTVRRLQAGDVEGFRALRLRALLDTPTAFGSSYEEDSALSEAALLARLAGASAVFAAFEDGAMVGMAGFHPQSGPKRRHRGLLWGVFVAKEQRGRGLARRLVEAVIGHASQHALVMEAGVTVGNQFALALYESLGFRQIGRLPRALFVDGVFHDEILLVLDMEPSAPEV